MNNRKLEKNKCTDQSAYEFLAIGRVLSMREGNNVGADLD